MTIPLPTLTFKQTFSNGYLVIITVTRAEGECPRITSDRKNFVDDALEAEYQAWVLECSTLLLTELLTPAEIEAMQVKELEKQICYEFAFNPEKLGFTHEQWAVMIEHEKQSQRDECKYQVDALIDAGWRMIIPEGGRGDEPWQWYWRRPSRRKGQEGRKYLSTNQAYNALQKLGT